jgi:type II secretory pathway pseudopilin PulG
VKRPFEMMPWEARFESRQSQAREGRVRAFTVTELLVVICVLGLLTALLFPALGKTRQKAQGMQCMNNCKQLILAFHLYAADHNDWLPPNPEDGHSAVGWVKGDMTRPLEATNRQFLTDPRYAKLAPYEGGTANVYRCPADKSQVRLDGVLHDRVRTISMNQAVGTLPQLPLSAVDGPWLNGTGHDNRANGPWRTYGRLADMVSPKPERLWVFLDEDEHSINDAAFGVSMVTPTYWIDWPGTYHSFSAGLGFADGHSEVHKWRDRRTRVQRGNVQAQFQPGNPDIVWLQNRTSALYP